MADMVLLALRRNLANAEKLGDIERAKRLQSRIADLEKPAEAPAAAAAPKPTVKKATKAAKKAKK